MVPQVFLFCFCFDERPRHNATPQLLVPHLLLPLPMHRSLSRLPHFLSFSFLRPRNPSAFLSSAAAASPPPSPAAKSEPTYANTFINRIAQQTKKVTETNLISAKAKKIAQKEQRRLQALALTEALCQAEEWNMGTYKRVVLNQLERAIKKEDDKKKSKSWTSSLIRGFKPAMTRPELEMLNKVMDMFTPEELKLQELTPELKQRIFQRIFVQDPAMAKHKIAMAKNLFSQQQANIKFYQFLRPRYLGGLPIPDDMAHLEAMVFQSLPNLSIHRSPKPGGFLWVSLGCLVLLPTLPRLFFNSADFFLISLFGV